MGVKIKYMQIGSAAHVGGPEDAQFVRDAERPGVSSVRVAEARGQDAFTPLAYLAALERRFPGSELMRRRSGARSRERCAIAGIPAMTRHGWRVAGGRRNDC